MSVVARHPMSWLGEARKFPAFFRRDVLVAWSYRLGFFVDWINVLVQILIFVLVAKLVDDSLLPTIDGKQITYLEFVITGIAVAMFLQIAFARVINSIREEQLMGTLESLLMTPTSPFAVLIGSVTYDIAYVPIRTVIFLGLTAAVFDVNFNLQGIGPLALILFAFIPVAWGLGMIGAGTVITYRRGVSAITFLVTIMMIASNAYVPLSVLPGWLRELAELNPVSIALEGARSALLGDGGWAIAWEKARILLPIGLFLILLGSIAVRAALARERRLGTLGLY